MTSPHFLALALLFTLLPPALHAADADGKLHIVVFGGYLFEQKLDGLHEIASQVYESSAPVRGVPPASDDAARRAWLKTRWSTRQRAEAEKHRDLLVKLCGEEAGRAVQFAETFEVSEYGRQPSPEELRKLFPFFAAK